MDFLAAALQECACSPGSSEPGQVRARTRRQIEMINQQHTAGDKMLSLRAGLLDLLKVGGFLERVKLAGLFISLKP